MYAPNKISNSILQFAVYAFLPGGLLLFVLLLLKVGIIVALCWAAVPCLLFFLFSLLRRVDFTLFGVFIANYFIMGITRYIHIPGGIVMDLLLFLCFSLILFRGLVRPIEWGRVNHPLTFLSFIWLIYCSLLIFHPDTTPTAWSAGIRGVAVYLFVFPLLVSLVFHKYKHLKFFLYLWSGLTALAVIKALTQKFIGFDVAEKIWLYHEGASQTHIIYTGIRYFSFFTDAASFGSSMGLSMLVFSICAAYTKNKWLRIYFVFIAIGACYGMIISGTRAAMAIPFAGYITYFLLSKQWKVIIPGGMLLLVIFLFFNYTNIGNSNMNIYRMRSAFKFSEDASFQVRRQNQERMLTFMQDKPLGIGIGKAKRAEPGDYMYQLPTDSSLVLIWVETGLVGLFFFISIFLFVLIKGSYDVLFRISNPQLRGVLAAFLAGIAGMLVCSYGNEMLQQFPNGPILYTLMAFVMLGTKFDQQLADHEGK